MSVTNDPNDPGLKKVGADGMQEKYLVLSEEERAKGFVRPLRRSYRHSGRVVCGKPRQSDGREGWHVCVCDVGHAGECSAWQQVKSFQDALSVRETHRLGGCGTVTTMGLALCETYARDPKFYGGTFCAGCRTHLPLDQFVWSEDGAVVGS